MNISHRINARKIVLSYFYQICFFEKLLTQDAAIDEALYIDNTFKTQEEKFSHEREIFLNMIKKYLIDESESDLMYILTNFFDGRKKEEVDIDYILKVGNGFEKYKNELIEKVNKYTKSFSYEQMDTIDQTLFLLGYVEYKSLETPKEVLLNELVELAKRYCDEGSPKLINGIMHNVFTEMQN